MAYTGSGPFKIIRACDPAIASCGQHDYGRYLLERDASVLVFNEGQKPEVFWGRPLSPQERREVANKISERDQYEAAFVRGLVKVENLTHEDGQQRDWTKPDDAHGKERMISDAVLDRYFDEATIQEIGMVIRNRSFLGRTRGGSYPLPAISQSALEAKGNALRVAVMAASSPSAQTKSEAKAQPAAPAESPSSPAGDASTVATATG